MAFPDNKQVREVCKIGQGAECCRYLTMGANGWSCEKLSEMGITLDAKALAGSMTARADNCPGLESR